VENAGEALNFGDRLSVADLEALTYRPSKGQIGEAGAFLFVARDGQGGVTAGRVPITVVRSNENPLVAAASRIAWPEIPLGIEAPSDPDGDPLTVTVLSVPTIGEVRNGGAALGVGDSLSVEALTGLTFDPSAGAAGEFAYEVADDHGGVSTSSITISLPGPAGIATVAATTGPSEPDQPEAAETPATAVPPQVAAAEARPTPSFNPQMRNTTPEDQLEDEAPASASDGALLETLTASNIRNAPGTSAGWIAEVPAGTPLKLIRKIEDRNWYQIEMPDGRGGFISGSLTRLLEKEEPLEVAAVSEQPLAPQSPPEPPQQREEVKVAAVDPTALPPTEDFVECATCPVMVALPGGQFRMGSADGDPSEQPVREVEIAAPVAIGKYEVTVAQWQACASAGFCPKIADPEPDADHRPVQNISWADAESFVAWLRAETEQPYRLPTEAEWEYAARGGQQTRFWWGDSFEAGRANCAECDSGWDRKHPADIGAYEPNPFGLYGMNGGVSEWVADCWIGDYQDAPDNGAARSLDFCPQRVLRGGSWRSEIEDVTSSSRFRYDAQVRYYTNGFRVARDL
jgi:formylglycine-generating enzyme required for sulfatase activity